MGNLFSDELYDNGLNHVINNCNLMALCEGQPTTYAEGNNEKGSGGFKLGEVVMTPADFTGPANGDVSGRKIETVQKTGGSVLQAGSGNHVALLDTVNSVLLAVLRESQQATGTAQAGTTTSLTLDAGDGAADDTYTGMTLRIVSGTGAGQDNIIITGHTGGVLTFAAISTPPDNTSVYSIYGIDVQTGAGNSITFEAGRIELNDPAQ